MKLTPEQQYMLSVLHSQYHASADALVTLGASASIGVVLTPKSRNIPSLRVNAANALFEPSTSLQHLASVPIYIWFTWDTKI